MTQALRLGYKASAEQFGPTDLLGFAVEAERCGFDSVMVSDHFQPWRHHDGHSPFAFAWLAAAAERTSRVVLGTSVTTPSFRYHPSVVAQAFATLGSLYPGRMLLGVGSGESLNEVPALGIAWPDQRERSRRLQEAVELIRRLWSEERVTFDGEYFHTRLATIYDKPPQPVPIYIAASGPLMAKFAGREGDGFICTSGKGMELYRDRLLPALREGAQEAGRADDALDKMIEVKVSFDTDRDRALKDTRVWAALALPAEDKAGVDDPLEMERRAQKVADPERRWIVSSDPDEHLEQLAPYLDLGFTHLVFHAPGEDQARFLSLYSEKLLPRIRKRWPAPVPIGSR